MAPKQKKQAGAGAQPLPVVEAKFTELANTFYEKVLDLNVAQSSTAGVMTDVLNMRAKLLGMYGVSADSWKPGCFVQVGAGAAALAGAEAEAAMAKPWTQKLHEAMTKTLKKTLTKNDVIYDTVAADEKNQTFTSTCWSPLFPGKYTSSEPAASKKAAEHAAAKLAFEAEYPALFAQLAAPAPAPVTGQKRKVSVLEDDSNLKGKLSHFITLLLKRSITKEDLIYEVQESPGDCSATVKMPTYKASMSFSGKGATRKDAEAAAAKAACAGLDGVVKPLLEENAAKKAMKNKESIEKLKKQTEEKKAAKAAAAATA